MKIAYVFGPLRADSHADVLINLLNAQEVAIKLWKAGFAVICPHLNTAEVLVDRGNGTMNIKYMHENSIFSDMVDAEQLNQIFVDGDLEMVRVSDFLVCSNAGKWKTSKGSMEEFKQACDPDDYKPVYFDVDVAIRKEKQ